MGYNYKCHYCGQLAVACRCVPLKNVHLRERIDSYQLPVRPLMAFLIVRNFCEQINLNCLLFFILAYLCHYSKRQQVNIFKFSVVIRLVQSELSKMITEIFM
jgi:hypothetical protein